MKKIITKLVILFEKLGWYDCMDVNHDGIINAQDYILIKDYIMNKECDK